MADNYLSSSSADEVVTAAEAAVIDFEAEWWAFEEDCSSAENKHGSITTENL